MPPAESDEKMFRLIVEDSPQRPFAFLKHLATPHFQRFPRKHETRRTGRRASRFSGFSAAFSTIFAADRHKKAVPQFDAAYWSIIVCGVIPVAFLLIGILIWFKRRKQ